MIVDQCPFGLADGLLDRVQLLGEVQARPAVTEHLDDLVQVTLRAPQPLHDFGVGFMNVIFCHSQTLSPGRGYDNVENPRSRKLPPATLSRGRAALSVLSDIALHVLRHSFVSIAKDLGFTEVTIAALVGHAKGSVTSKYIHTLDTALIMAADTISGYIQGLLDGIEFKQTAYALDRDSRKAALARFLKRASGGGPQEDEVERRLAA